MSQTPLGSQSRATVATYRVPVVIRWFRWALAGSFVVYALWVALSTGEDNSLRDVWLSSALLLMAAVLLASRAILRRDDRWAWAALALGVLIWTIADVLYSAWISQLDPVPYPSIADWMYLVFYPFAYAALIIFLLHRIHRPPLSVWLDALIVALGAGAFIALALPSIYANITGEPTAIFMSAANPLSDLLLLCLLLGILGVLSWRADRMWWLLLLGFFMLWITDSAWLLSVADDSYSIGALIDIGWPAGFLLIAFAAWQRRASSVISDMSLAAAAVPIFVTICSFALLVTATQQPMPTLAVALASAALVVGGCRSAQALRLASVYAEIRRQAYTDDLTGIENRRLLNLRLAEAMTRESTQDFALLILDVDDFKRVNDSLGHPAGDDVLQWIAARLSAGLRSGDNVARLGGDEFSLLLGPGTTLQAAMAVAQRISAAFLTPIRIGGMNLKIDLSIGVAAWPEHGRTREELMQAADKAMYRAKSNRTRIEMFDPALDLVDRGRLQLLQDLRVAITNNEIICHYQPKLDLATGKVFEVEALARWCHPALGLLPPASFIELAEKAGLIGELTDRVIEVSLAQVASWRTAQLQLAVAVNLSTTNLLDLGLAKRVSNLLARYDVPASRLVFEITETVFVADLDRVREVVSTLSALGVTFSIDDYGMGYSSLAQLQHLAAQELKLDRSFVTDLHNRPDLLSIVHSTVAMAHELGMRVVTEGVETQADLDEVVALGCDSAQGYYICRPGLPEVIEKWVRDTSSHRGSAIRA